MNNISYVHGQKVLEKDGNRYLLLPSVNIYSYLQSRNFSQFLLPISKNKEEDIFLYEEDSVPLEDKAKDLILLLSLLHIKTTTYQKVVVADIREFYQTMSEKLDYQMKYYMKLQDQIEEVIYMAPEEYLFIRHVSLFYQCLKKSKEYLDKWYELIQKEDKMRIVLLHGSPSLFNFVDLDNPYLRNFELARKDSPIYDFLFFYKKYYEDLEMISLFQLYQQHYSYNEVEKNLFYCLLLFCDNVINFSSEHFENVVVCNKLIRYFDYTLSFILKQDEKNEETDKEKFQ